MPPCSLSLLNEDVCACVCASVRPQFTPVLGVVSALLVFCFLREPERGKADGHSTGKGVRGKHGVVAYLKDVLYCIRV